jgi:nucleoside-diphosphate-sugar epimerase
MNPNKPSILITGASGMVGGHIALQLLSSGISIRLLVRNRKKTEHYLNELIDFYKLELKLSNSIIEWCEGDLSDIPALEIAMQGMTSVIHAAALVSVYSSDTSKMNKSNIEGTANLVNLALVHKIEWFGYVSSVATLGPNPDGLVDEDYFWKPGKHHTIYATSKYMAEQEVWRGQEEGLSVLVVNPAFIIGPSTEERSSARVFYQLNRGIPGFINGEGGYVDVRDVAQSMVNFWKKQECNKRIILSSENLTTQAFLKKSAVALNAKIPNREVSGWMVKLASRIDGLISFFLLKRPTLTKDLVRMSLSKNRYDNQKSIDIGVQYRSVDQSLAEIAPFYQAQFQK